MERLHTIKWYLNKKSGSLKKRVGGRENKGNLETDETNTVQKKLILNLADVEMIGFTWRENTPVKKDWQKQSWWTWRICIRIGVWEHHYEKGMESTFDFEATRIPHLKTKQGLACRISQNKHMIEISSEVFVVGPTRARSYSTIMYKAVHMTYEASPSRDIQGLFKTQWDHCKTDRE